MILEDCLNNEKFFWDCLEKKVRLDGRRCEDSRDIFIYYTNHDSCEVTIGKTKTVCKIKSEIIKPHDKRPNEGVMKLNVDADSFTSVNDSNKTSEATIEIRSSLERIIRSSNTINFESLCIIPGDKVWCLHIQVTVIENDGNMLDACFLSLYGALIHYKIQKVKINFWNLDVEEQIDEDGIPISIHNSVILTTFAYFENEDLILVDPSSIEEELASSLCSIALNKEGNVVCVLKEGGCPVEFYRILDMMELANQKVGSVLKKLYEALEEYSNNSKTVMKSNLHVQYFSEPISILFEGVKEEKEIPLDNEAYNALQFRHIIKKYQEKLSEEWEEDDEELSEDNDEDDDTYGSYIIQNRKQEIINAQLREMKHQLKNSEENVKSNNRSVSKNKSESNEISTERDVSSVQIANGKVENIKGESSDYKKLKKQDMHDHFVNSVNHKKSIKTNSSQKDEGTNGKEKKMTKVESRSKKKEEEESDVDFSLAISTNMKNTSTKKKKK